MDRFITLFIIGSFLVACSSGDKVNQEDKQIAVLEDGLILNETGEDGVVELVIPEVAEYTEVKREAETQANMSTLEPGVEAVSEEDQKEVQETIAAIGQEPEVVEPEDIYDPSEEVAAVAAPYDENNYTQEYKEEFEEYIVQKNDSLMLISFKLYNKFENWRDLAEWNNVSSVENYTIREGDKLKFKVRGANGVVWNPNGDPYLIRRGDYLEKISKKRYEGQGQYWYDIWKNNDVLIHHPDRIYTGFTIYTESYEQVQQNEMMRKQQNVNPLIERDLAGKKEEAESL